MKMVSLVVPVYYNADSLPLLFQKLSQIERKLKEKDLNLQIIFIDDGSKDHSLDELKKIKAQRPETTIIKLTRNFGSVSASHAGLKFVKGDCFMVLSADLQDPPELILQMVDKWLEGDKYIICTRKNRNDPLISKIWAAIYYFLLRIFVLKDYPPEGFDLALLDKAMLPYMQNRAKNINPPLFSYWLGFKPTILTYERLPRIHGKSRWTFGKKVKFFLDSILGFSILPIRMLSLVGLLVACVSFVYGTLVFVNAIFGHIHISGFATIVILISFLLGLIIVMLGMIGEYIWRIFDETNKRPEFVIDEVI